MGKQPGMVHGPRGERHGPGELAMANGKQQLLLAQVEIREALQPREHLNPAGLTGPRASPPQLRENSFTAQPQQRLGPAQADLGQISTDLAGKGMGGVDHHLAWLPNRLGPIQGRGDGCRRSDRPKRWLQARVGRVGPQGRPTDQAELHVPAHGQQG